MSHDVWSTGGKERENILTLSDIILAFKDSGKYFLLDDRNDIAGLLNSLHSTGLINVLKSEDKVWVVVNRGMLLTEVDGILFAPKTFKEHIDIASNTGIVSVSRVGHECSATMHFQPLVQVVPRQKKTNSAHG